MNGTSRPDNFTAKALAVVVDDFGSRSVATTVFDGRSMSLAFPGQPGTDDAVRLGTAVKEASGVVLATPEYHGGFSAFTKLEIENLGFPPILAGSLLEFIENYVCPKYTLEAMIRQEGAAWTSTI